MSEALLQFNNGWPNNQTPVVINHLEAYSLSNLYASGYEYYKCCILPNAPQTKLLCRAQRIDANISVEIQATSRDGFDENLQRTVNENCSTLKFTNADFEHGTDLVS